MRLTAAGWSWHWPAASWAGRSTASGAASDARRLVAAEHACLGGRLLGTYDSHGQMTYDLRRLRLNGFIRRVEYANRYVLTPDGIRVAVFYTKLYNRLLGPLIAATSPKRHPNSGLSSKPFTATSTPPSTAPASRKPPET
jgi:hypothetical protein